MEQHLQTGVKSLIEAYPKIGEILTRYGIGCVPCTVGTCALADVVKIHTLDPADEIELMAQIEEAIYPDRVVSRRPAPPRPQPAAPRELRYSPPVQRLVEEHTWIKRLLALIPAMLREMEGKGEVDANLTRRTISFIRDYADRFHHLKEEDILFDYTDREAEIIKVIYADHDTGRGHIRAALQAIADYDVAALAEHLTSYAALLTEHIKKEDEVLYPFLDRSLTTAQVGQMYQRFNEAEQQVPADTAERNQRLIEELEARFRAVADAEAG